MTERRTDGPTEREPTSTGVRPANERGSVVPSSRRPVAPSLSAFYAYRLLATSYLYVPIFMLFQADRGLTFFERFALGGLYCAVLIVVEVPTGVFADRYGRRLSMLCGALAMVVSTLIATLAHGFPTFAVAESLAALSMALCSGADSAYLYDLLVAHDRADEYPRKESIASAWHLLGSALAFAGGGLLARVDLEAPYIATAIVAAMAAGLAACHVEPARAPATRRTSWPVQIVAALADVARNGRLAWIVGYSAIVFALLRATVYVYQPYLQDRGLTPLEIGLLFAGVYLLAAVVAHRTHWLRARFGDEPLLWFLLGTLAISFLGLAGAARGPWMLALLVVQAIANGVYSPLTKPLLNREIHDSGRRAAVLSVESMARRFAMGVFAPLCGVMGETHVMQLCGAAGIAGLILLAVARLERS